MKSNERKFTWFAGITVKKSLTPALALVVVGLFVSLGVSQQMERGNVTLRKPEVRKATLTQVGSTWVLNCISGGKDCYVVRLVNAKRPSPGHDAELEEYTNRINAILDELRTTNKDSSREPVFIATPYAPFLAWCRLGDTKGLPEGASTREDGSARFYQPLGISLDSYRPKATRFWYYSGAFICKRGGDTQLAGRLLKAESLSPIHDRVLEDYTNRINAVLDEAAKGGKNRQRQLSLLVTFKGLFLAWTRDDDTDGPLPKGAITAADNDAKVAEALGI